MFNGSQNQTRFLTSISDNNSCTSALFDQEEVKDARAQALRDAAIAFEKLDFNGDGTIDYAEAEKLIGQSDGLMKDAH